MATSEKSAGISAVESSTSAARRAGPARVEGIHGAGVSAAPQLAAAPLPECAADTLSTSDPRELLQCAGEVLREVASKAHDLSGLLINLVGLDLNTEEGTSAVLDGVCQAFTLCSLIGCVADRGGDALGAGRLRDGVDEWLLSPLAAGSMAKIRQFTGEGGAA